jgi:hypothetical protein
MKKGVLIILTPLVFLACYQPANAKGNDTLRITHSFDGNTKEWPETAFTTDKETFIKYAIDNDNEFIFIAMRIPEFRMQMKMGRLGMNLYIDAKGKKKESKGIEFPVKGEEHAAPANSGMRQPAGSNNGQRTDKKAIRATIASNMIYMNVFGFDEGGTVAQGLTMPGRANIAFSWDSTDALNIEYRIPVSLLGDAASLDQKTIGIGWKINGRTIPPAADESELRGNGGGEGRGGNRPGGSGEMTDRAEMERMMKDQSFWTRYTISLAKR